MKKEIPWNLIIQKLKHDITAEEEHDLTVWLAEDNHRVIFEELQTLWQKVQEIWGTKRSDKMRLENKYR